MLFNRVLPTLFVACIALGMSLEADARAGGGGGNGGSGSGWRQGSRREYRSYDQDHYNRFGYRRRWRDPRLYKFIAALGGAALIYFAFGRATNANRIRKAIGDFKRAHQLDPSWDIHHISKTIHDTFHLYQQAWMAGDLQPIQHLFHPDYFQQAERRLSETLGQGLINVIKDPLIASWDVYWVRDMPRRDGDVFIAQIRARMVDYTINASNNWFVSSPVPQGQNEPYEAWVHRAMREPLDFTEYWAFMRVDGQWRLLMIQQSETLLSGLMQSTDQALEAILLRAKGRGQPPVGHKIS